MKPLIVITGWNNVIKEITESCWKCVKGEYWSFSTEYAKRFYWQIGKPSLSSEWTCEKYSIDWNKTMCDIDNALAKTFTGD